MNKGKFSFFLCRSEWCCRHFFVFGLSDVEWCNCVVGKVVYVEDNFGGVAINGRNYFSMLYSGCSGGFVPVVDSVVLNNASAVLGELGSCNSPLNCCFACIAHDSVVEFYDPVRNWRGMGYEVLISELASFFGVDVSNVGLTGSRLLRCNSMRSDYDVVMHIDRGYVQNFMNRLRHMQNVYGVPRDNFGYYWPLRSFYRDSLELCFFVNITNVSHLVVDFKGFVLIEEYFAFRCIVCDAELSIHSPTILKCIDFNVGEVTVFFPSTEARGVFCVGDELTGIGALYSKHKELRLIVIDGLETCPSIFEKIKPIIKV